MFVVQPERDSSQASFAVSSRMMDGFSEVSDADVRMSTGPVRMAKIL